MPPENDGDSNDTGDNKPNDQPDPLTSLSDEGRKALAVERSRADQSERARKLETKQREKAETELARLREAGQSESEQAVERAKRETADVTRKEVLTQANRRILTAEVRAAAGGRLADPLDAVRLLDVDSFSVNDDGEVDSKAIAKALDTLLDLKPYLALNAKRVEGSADGGARERADDSANVSPGMGRLVAGYTKNAKP